MKNFHIMTDSLSSRLSLKDRFTRHSILQRIQITLHTLISRSTRIIFVWIPGHAISEHDLLDSAANEATKLPKITLQISLPLADLKKFYSNHINTLWNSFWLNQQSNKLYQIKLDTTVWPSSIQL